MAATQQPTSMPRLSRAEWEIIRICWRLGEVSCHDVLREVLKKSTREYRTVVTFLDRITRKGYLRVEKKGRVKHYTATISPETALRHEIRFFLAEVIGLELENLRLLREMVDDELERNGHKSS